MSAHLFPRDTKELEWVRFAADGFAEPVSGIVYTADRPPCCGVPVGGLATGCLDVDARGIWGWSSIFNPIGPHPGTTDIQLPRRVPRIEPVLGLSVGGKTWVLAAASVMSGGDVHWCSEPYGVNPKDRPKPILLPCPKLEGVELARSIRTWGHWPVVDLEYGTDAPVSVAMRAWAPFIPGDAAVSNTPAAVFEVRLDNASREAQRGAIAFNFPGPDREEAGAVELNRVLVREDFHGILVAAEHGVDYFLGVLAREGCRFGAGLGGSGTAWAKISCELPRPAFREDRGIRWYRDASASAAVDFSLEPNASATVRFVLAWHAPVRRGQTKKWPGRDDLSNGRLHFRWVGSPAEGDRHHYVLQYAARFGSSLEAARRIAADHAPMLARVLRWQEAIYADPGLPPWLADALVNNLCLIAEDSHWVQPRPPLGDWAFPGGAFALDESPRGCPHTACIPCDWYGNLPIVFFFPELARSTLRAFKAYQAEDGEIPFAIGKIDVPDFAVPEFGWQVSLNGFCFADMVDRLWLATRDDSVISEFYDAVKRSTVHWMGLSDKSAPAIRMPDVGGMEWFEFGDWAGMTAHAGGLRLAGLAIVERMAAKAGDEAFAAQCRAWREDGQRAMETEMWTGSYYLNFLEPETGRRSDEVMGYQLDGEWTARYHGLPGVFRKDRLPAVLDTIERCNIALTPTIGAANFARPDGSAIGADSKIGYYGQYTMFTPELLVLAMTFIQAGRKDFGLELARRYWTNLCLVQRHPFDTPNMIDGRTGERQFGTDYYQNMMLWALPGVLAGGDLRSAVGPGSLVARVKAAGR